MPTTIKLKNSVTTTNTPTSLVQGEVAINITDKKVWVGNAATTPIQLLGTGADGTFTNISVSSVATFGAGTVSAPAITTTGDTNTGIYFPAADTIAFTEGGVESMRIDANGNMGVGVTPNTWTLGKSVSVGDVGSAVFGFGGYNSLGSGAYFNSGWKYSSSSSSQKPALFVASDGAFTFSYAAAGTAGNAISFSEAMRIDSSGNVGIGTSSPSAPLDIQSNSGGTGIRVRGRASANAGAIRYFANDNTTQRARIESNDTSLEINSIASLPITFNTADTERMRITSGGSLLVGTTSTSGTSGIGFKVNPSATYPQTSQVGSTTSNSDTTHEMYSTGASAYRFYVGYGGTVYATNTTISAISDQRLKENIVDLDDGLNAVMALKPRKFDWKEGKGKGIKNDRGFIAQEFETVFPDMIEEWKDPAPEGEEPYKAVNANLIPTLVKAIQEQQAMIEELKQEVAKLKGN